MLIIIDLPTLPHPIPTKNLKMFYQERKTPIETSCICIYKLYSLYFHRKYECSVGFFTPNIKDKEKIGKNILMIHLFIHQMSKYCFNEFIHKSEFHMKTLN